MKTKALIILIAVLVVAAAGYLVFNKNQGVKEPLNTQNQEQTSGQKKNKIPAQPEKVKVETQAVANNELPKDFPGDIPLEAKAEVIRNYNAVNANGEFQASRVFISKKTVAENYVLYQQALKEKGWNIINTEENTSAGSPVFWIFAEKSNYKLNIRIFTDADNKVEVSINNIVVK